MIRKSFSIIVILLCFWPLMAGCPKKTVVKEEPSIKKTEDVAAERERAARLEAERALREKELKAKEEEAKRALALKELEAERERAARLEAERGLREKELKAKEEEAKRALALKELEAERERAARLEAERALRERELKAKEEEAKRALALKELEAERERIARLEAERAAREAKERELARAREEEARRALAEKEKEFEKSLVARKTPGIEGEVFESHLLKGIHFDFDKYDIRIGDAEILKGNAALLKKYSNVKIQIEGHCDEKGTVEYNLALGERRANSTKDYLISLGISADRISTISYGEERPSDPGHNEEAWAKNRRGHFVILSK